MLQYSQKRVVNLQDLEKRQVTRSPVVHGAAAWLTSLLRPHRLNALGYRVGSRVFELLSWREKNSKREIRIIGILSFIHTTVWKSLFGQQADAIQKSTENADEYMLIDNEPLIAKFISIPRELSQLSCGSFLAGIVESILDAAQFVSCQVDLL